MSCGRHRLLLTFTSHHADVTDVNKPHIHLLTSDTYWTFRKYRKPEQDFYVFFPKWFLFLLYINAYVVNIVQKQYYVKYALFQSVFCLFS